MSGTKAGWLRKEHIPMVSLSGPASPRSAQPTGGGFLRRQDIAPAMEAQIRLVASVFPGTKVEIEGIWRPIAVSP